MSKTHPKFLSFEGGEGAGKSTLVKNLFDWLSKNGHDAIMTREPGGSIGAEEIRTVLLKSRATESDWSTQTEMLLFLAARRDHVEKVIWPALSVGKWVLCDRFLDSSFAYQSESQTDLTFLVEQHNKWIGLTPGRTFFLDIDPRQALIRRSQRASRSRKNNVFYDENDRFEARNLAFHQQLYKNYLALVDLFPDRIVKLDATLTTEQLRDQIIEKIEI